MGFLSWQCWITKILKDIQKLTKILEVFRRSIDIVEVKTALTLSLRTCIDKCDLIPSAFYLKKEVLTFTQAVQMFGNCAKQSCNHSHFSQRYQLMKSMIGNYAINKSTSIDKLVNWYRLVSANPWPIDSHKKKVIDWHRLAIKFIDWQLIHQLASIGNSVHDRCSRG